MKHLILQILVAIVFSGMALFWFYFTFRYFAFFLAHQVVLATLQKKARDLIAPSDPSTLLLTDPFAIGFNRRIFEAVKSHPELFENQLDIKFLMRYETMMYALKLAFIVPFSLVGAFVILILLFDLA